MTPEVMLPLARKLLRTHQVSATRPEDLVAALSAGRPRHLESGEALCVEGETSDALFILLQGHVQVLRKDFQGTPRELAVMEAPALVGHMGLVDGSPRSATCLAKGAAGVLVIDKALFQRLLQETTPGGGALRRLILGSLIQQLTIANGKIRELIAEEPASPAPKPAPAAAPRQPSRVAQEARKKAVTGDDLLQLAGVLEGWKVESDDLAQGEITFTEDDDMRRTREAREAARRRK